MGVVHSLIHDNNGPFYFIFFFKSIQIFFQGIGIAHISTENIHADGDSIFIHEQPHLNDGRQAVFPGYSLLSKSGTSYHLHVSILVSLIRVRKILFRIVIGYIIKGVFQFPSRNLLDPPAGEDT